MMQRKHEIGRNLGPQLDKITEPRESFIGGEQKRLYDLEAARNATIVACAKEWLAIKGLDEDHYWPEAVPQALFDTLESYSPQYAIVGAEAFLKQFGWTFQRPGQTRVVHVVTAEHFNVPGTVTKLCATREKAVAEAIKLVNIMLDDAGVEDVTTEADMNTVMETLQETYGAAHCYVDIAEHEVI